MTRAKPVSKVGIVSILAPKGDDPYYRCTWTRADGKAGRTTAGRTLEDAKAKAESIDRFESRAAGARSYAPIEDAVKEWVSTPVRRNQKRHGADWSDKQHSLVTRLMTKMMRVLDGEICLEMDRALADRLRAQAGTPNGVQANTSVLRCFLRWGVSAGYFTPAIGDLLPVRTVMPDPDLAGTPAPPRSDRARLVGSHEDYIDDEDVPTIDDLRRLADEMDRLLPLCGRLMVEFAADSGPRWAEQMQLTALDIVVSGKPHVLINHQLNEVATKANGLMRRKPPKGGKRRITGLAEATLTGYPLREEMLARRTAALAEQARGENPEALLFPINGRLLFSSEFHADLFTPAATAAGWMQQTWVEKYSVWDPSRKAYVVRTRQRSQWIHVWHSLRHLYARTCVDVRNFTPGELMATGGWENMATVMNRYYRSGKDNQASALGKF